jgi:hypothetical protein
MAIWSDWPRKWDPPEVEVVSTGFCFATPDCGISGRILQVQAEAICDQLKNRNLGSLCLFPDDDHDRSLGVLYLGVRASSYYFEVLRSQGYPSRRFQYCSIVSWPGDPELPECHLKRTEEEAATPAEKGEIVKEAGNFLEEACRSTRRRRKKTAFAGGLLTPTVPSDRSVNADEP